MEKNTNLLNFGTFTVVVLTVFLLALVTHEKLQVLDSKSIPLAKETPVSIAKTSTSLKDSIVNFGMEFLGTPYLAGGCGKNGFDCSGFVYFVFQHFKIHVPRSSLGFKHFGTEIEIENVQKGDVLLFLSPTRNVIGHVGIVSNPKGKESDFIHASSGGEKEVIISNLAKKGYKRRFVKAIRVL